MKNTITVLLAVLVLLILNITFNVSNSHAQWQSDVRLTNAPDTSLTSYNNSWCIASNGNVVHVVWSDKRDGNWEIYYKRSPDGGINWGADTRLTYDPAISNLSAVSVSGQLVHVVWRDYRDGNQEIYYKRSADGGINWGADIRLTNDPALSQLPSLAVSASTVHIVWREDRSGNMEIFYKRSTDGGLNWSVDIPITANPSYYSYNTSVSVSGQVVHVVWNRDMYFNNTEIFYRRSTDGGVNWEAETRLTNDPGSSQLPSIAVFGLNVHVAWYDSRDGNSEIYYKRSTDGGVSWDIDTRLTDALSSSLLPSVAVSGSNVHIVWYDVRDGNTEIYYKLSTDGGINWGTDTRLTNDPSVSMRPSISISNSALHVVWSDNRDGNYEMYYKRNPTGNPTGIAQIKTEKPNEYKLMQNYPNPFNPVTKINFDIPVCHSGEGRNPVVKLVT